MSVAEVVLKLDTVKTLVWNGPFGAFELPPFDTATVTVAKAAAARVKAAARRGRRRRRHRLRHEPCRRRRRPDLRLHRGGAFLEWMEGKPLPGVEALRKG